VSSIPLRRAALASALSLLCACAHAPVTRAGAECDDFTSFDAQTRRELDELLARAPGDRLLTEASRLNRERRACARRALSALPALREARGPDAVQRELDALVATYRRDDLDALLAETLGDDALALRPQLAEARVRHERSQRATAAAQLDAATAHRTASDAPAWGAFDAEREKAERDAQRLLARQEEERQRADHAVTGTTSTLPTPVEAAPHTSLAPLAALRPADDVTAEALRALDDATPRDGACRAPSPCERLACAELTPPEADTLGRACLDATTSLLPDDRARAVARVLARLRDFGRSGAATEAQRTLETLRRQLWPEVEAAVARGARGVAAQRASPFLALDAVRGEVQRLRDEAQAHHLSRAKALAKTPTAAWLHARIAEELGGPAASPTPPEKGRWLPPRWRCSAPPPAQPALPPGMEASLHVTCSEPRRDTSELRTFDLGLEGVRVEGTLVVTCASSTLRLPLRAEEPGVSGFPSAAFDAALAGALSGARRQCSDAHAQGAAALCAELGRRTIPELKRRFTLAAWLSGAWAPCVAEWLLTAEDVLPPRAR
jgi:hypothetical protein